MKTLTIPINGVYFDQIKAGTKPEEYRLVTPFWSKRLVGRTYDRLVLTRGYPKADDASRRIELLWRGYEVKTITHPHFGADPVEVFAIKVSPAPPEQSAAGHPVAVDGGTQAASEASELKDAPAALSRSGEP